MTTLIRTRLPLQDLSMSNQASRRSSKRIAGMLPWQAGTGLFSHVLLDDFLLTNVGSSRRVRRERWRLHIHTRFQASKDDDFCAARACTCCRHTRHKEEQAKYGPKTRSRLTSISTNDHIIHNHITTTTTPKAARATGERKQDSSSSSSSSSTAATDNRGGRDFSTACARRQAKAEDTRVNR